MAAKLTRSVTDQSHARQETFLTEPAGVIFDRICIRIQDVSCLIDQRTHVREEHDQVLAEVDYAVSQLDNVVQSNTAISEESASANE